MSTLGTHWPSIAKGPQDWPATPNLRDYSRACAEFSWSSARAALDGLPDGGGLNIAHEAVDRHAASDRARHVAFAAVLLFSLTIASNWTQDVPARYGKRHAGLTHSRLYPEIDTAPRPAR